MNSRGYLWGVLSIQWYDEVNGQDDVPVGRWWLIRRRGFSSVIDYRGRGSSVLDPSFSKSVKFWRVHSRNHGTRMPHFSPRVNACPVLKKERKKYLPHHPPSPAEDLHLATPEIDPYERRTQTVGVSQRRCDSKEKKNCGVELICGHNSMAAMVAMVAIEKVGVAHSRVHLSSGGQGRDGQVKIW